MKDIVLVCPHCSKVLATSDQSVGKSFSCPECTNPVTVPEPGASLSCPACHVSLLSTADFNPDSFTCPSCEATISGPVVKLRIPAHSTAAPEPAPPPEEAPAPKAPAQPAKLDIENDSPAPETPVPRRPRRTWILLAGAATIAIVAGGVVYLVGPRHPKTNDAETTAAQPHEASSSEEPSFEEIARSTAPKTAGETPPAEPAGEAEQPDLPPPEPRGQRIARIDAILNERFGLDAESPFVHIELTSGRMIEGRDLVETDTGYALRVPKNEGRTIFSRQTLRKRDVKSIRREKAIAEDTLWAGIRSLELPAGAATPCYHQRVIALVLDRFLKDYPNSQHADEVKTIRDTWQAEAQKLDGGYVKLGGRWLGPDDDPAPGMARDMLTALATVKSLLACGDYLRAADLCARLKIPAEYGSEREVFEAAVRTLLSKLQAELATTHTSTAEVRKQIDEQYEAALADIDSWKPQEVELARDPGETHYAHEARTLILRKEMEKALRIKQDNARKELKRRYEQALQQMPEDTVSSEETEIRSAITGLESLRVAAAPM